MISRTQPTRKMPTMDRIDKDITVIMQELNRNADKYRVDGLEIAMAGTVSFFPPAGLEGTFHTLGSVAHNLGYVPQFLSYNIFESGTEEVYYYAMPFDQVYQDVDGTFPTFQGKWYRRIYAMADINNLTFYEQRGFSDYPSLAVNYNFRYYIFKRPIDSIN